eukprot:gene12638-biopygen16950
MCIFFSSASAQFPSQPALNRINSTGCATPLRGGHEQLLRGACGAASPAFAAPSTRRLRRRQPGACGAAGPTGPELHRTRGGGSRTGLRPPDPHNP